MFVFSFSALSGAPSLVLKDLKLILLYNNAERFRWITAPPMSWLLVRTLVPTNIQPPCGPLDPQPVALILFQYYMLQFFTGYYMYYSMPF